MAKSNSSKSSQKTRPATTPEGRENQMIALAMDLAEKQLREGTASSQLITEFVKRGSTKARLEKEILEEQRELLVAKTKAIENEAHSEEMYLKVINALRKYNGQGGHDEDEY